MTITLLLALDQAGHGLRDLLLGAGEPLGMLALCAAALFVALVVARLPPAEGEAEGGTQTGPLDWSERLGPGRLSGCAAVFGLMGGLFAATAWKVWETGAGSAAPLLAGALGALVVALEFVRRALKALRARQD